MKALLIMAHGSPRPEANDDIRAVAEVVRERGIFALVTIGYLDCNAPDIDTAIDEAVAAGARSITAVPYFLHTGKHLLRDLPAALRSGIERHPGIEITLGRYLGSQPQMAAILRLRMTEAR